MNLSSRLEAARLPQPSSAVPVPRPPVPVPQITAPADGQEVYGEKDTGEVELRADLALPGGAFPYDSRVKVLVDGKEPEGAGPPEVDRERRAVTARVPLRPGRNRLEVRLSTDWGETSASPSPGPTSSGRSRPTTAWPKPNGSRTAPGGGGPR